MPRKNRVCSDTGVYHVMLRGINHQIIFEYQNDYLKLLQLLHQKCYPKDSDGKAMPACCVIYAYCLMPNHIHLLIQEKEERISDTIKSVGIAYAQYYNNKYDHSGHLFQDRFRSEPVNDWEYFVTLLRYIHQNPVAGGIVNRVKDYKWSSWGEFERTDLIPISLCPIESVLSRISYPALEELVNEPLPKAQRILDYNNETSVRIKDDVVRDYILSDCGVKNIKDIQAYPIEERNELIKKIKAFGASIRQITRLTGISERIIRKVTR